MPLFLFSKYKKGKLIVKSNPLCINGQYKNRMALIINETFDQYGTQSRDSIIKNSSKFGYRNKINFQNLYGSNKLIVNLQPINLVMTQGKINLFLNRQP